MSQSLQLKIAGLHSSQNDLSAVPEGALLVADNIDIVKDSIAEPRRGFARVDGSYPDGDDRTGKTWFYQAKQFAHHGTYGSEDTVSFLDTGVWTAVGAFAAPTGFRMRPLEANQNLYLTSATGIQKLDAYNGTPKLAGAFKALDLVASLSVSTGSALANSSAVAYRLVWGYRDANNFPIVGAPSQREVIANSSGNAKDVTLVATIPAGVTTAWFYQLYRSVAVSSSVEPSDELGLVYEGSPSSGDISAGTVSITDITPDALRGQTLYTSASQEGLANQNERPPLAKDMAVFRNTAFYGNVTSKHRYYLTLISVGGASGIAADDTVTIGGVAYTAKSSETIASAQFEVSTGGSASQNIRDTALSLVRVINRYSSSTVYAYYLSGPEDLPGMLLLEERSIGGSSFAATSSRATCWNPGLPSSGTSESSTNDQYKNGLFWSKVDQPEAVPLPNFVQVGSKDSQILRLVPLKDALFVFKEDGVFKVTGYPGSFESELVDSSARLLAPESCAVLNNQIFCLTDQGVTVVSDGVKIISRPIEQDLLQLFGADLNLVKTQSFGIGYETERKYYLFMASTAGDTYPTQAFVFNVFTNTWVRHVLSATAGVVYDNRLYLADAGSSHIIRDRKGYTYLDYADFAASTTITAIDGNVMTVADGSDLVGVGDVLFQSSSVFSIISAVDPIASTVTVQSNPGFTAAAVDLLTAIQVDMKWAPMTMGNPGITKQNHTVELLFKSDFNGTGYLTFSTDLSPAEESVPITGRGIGSWGLRSFGSGPWGGASLKRPVRQWVPRNKQRSTQLTLSFQHAYAFSPWQLQGVVLFGPPGSERIAR